MTTHLDIDALELNSVQREVLRNVNPATLAQDLTQTVRSYMARVALSLSRQYRWTEKAHPTSGSAFAITVEDLCRYAQYGLQATDWPDHTCLMDAIAELYNVLYSTGPIGEWEATVPNYYNPDATSPLGVVLLAACQRAKLSGELDATGTD